MARAELILWDKSEIMKQFPDTWGILDFQYMLSENQLLGKVFLSVYMTGEEAYVWDSIEGCADQDFTPDDLQELHRILTWMNKPENQVVWNMKL